MLAQAPTCLAFAPLKVFPGDFWDGQGLCRVFPQPVFQLQCLHGLFPPLFCSYLTESAAWKAACCSFLSAYREDIVGFP